MVLWPKWTFIIFEYLITDIKELKNDFHKGIYIEYIEKIGLILGVYFLNVCSREYYITVHCSNVLFGSNIDLIKFSYTLLW